MINTPFRAGNIANHLEMDLDNRESLDSQHQCKIYDFSANSCRSASTSKATLIMDIEDVIKKGCWKNARAFLEFYDKELL